MLDGPLPLTIIPLDVTHTALATPEVVARVRALGTPLAGVVGALIDFFRSTYASVFHMPDPPVHDAVAVARAIRPELVAVREVFAAVELQGEWTLGETVVDWHGRLGRPANCRIATALDVDAFWDLLVAALDRLGSGRAGT